MDSISPGAMLDARSPERAIELGALREMVCEFPVEVRGVVM
jgi:hypothetical protein